MRKVFIDSGAFIAYLVRNDRSHEPTVRLFSKQPRSSWSTSVLVVSETYSWFLHRHGEPAARSFAGLIRALPGLEVLAADADHLREVWRKAEALRGLKLTLVDASALVWLERRDIRTVWGTDHHLACEGATVVPGPPAG